MNRPEGSWGGGSTVARPAREQDIRYGHGLLQKESSAWPAYFAVTTPSAYRAAQPSLSVEPEAVRNAGWLDWGHLQEITDAVPASVELVVGIGGGVALDASKYVALKKGIPLVLVPTIASSGAIIHSGFAKWDGHKTVGPGASWPWVNFDHALIDYDVVLKAPAYLNTAGLGDVLCTYSGIAEWRRNSRLGVEPPFDKTATAQAMAYLMHVATGFPKTLDSNGALTADSIHFILSSIQARDDTGINHPAAPTADHSFWLAAEEVNDTNWVHGEFVALGALVIAWYCQEGADTLASWLDTCLVRRRPDEIGLSKDQLRKALEVTPTFMSAQPPASGTESILKTDPLQGRQIDALWDYLMGTC